MLSNGHSWNMTANGRGTPQRSPEARWGYTIHLKAPDGATVSGTVQIWGTNDSSLPGLPVTDSVTVSGTVNLASASAPYPCALAGKRDVPYHYHYPVISGLSANTEAVVLGAGVEE